MLRIWFIEQCLRIPFNSPLLLFFLATGRCQHKHGGQVASDASDGSCCKQPRGISTLLDQKGWLCLYQSKAIEGKLGFRITVSVFEEEVETFLKGQVV